MAEFAHQLSDRETGEDEDGDESRTGASKAPTEGVSQKDATDRAQESQPERVGHWWKYVVAGYLIRPIAFVGIIGAGVLATTLGGALGTTVVIGSITVLGASYLLLPLAIRADIRRITMVTDAWEPRSWWYLMGTTIAPPPMDSLWVSMYLGRRHRFVGTKSVLSILRGMF